MRGIYLNEPCKVGTMAKAVHIDDSLDAPSPMDLKPNDIIVNVKAFSINVDDIHMFEGTFLGGVPGMQRKPKKKEALVVGSDFAGVVTAIGRKVEGFKVGQRVCGMNKQQSAYSQRGTWAEYTVTQPNNLIPIPDDVSFEQAAACVLPLFVIHGLLNVKHKVKKDERVLVIGSSGGIGSMLVMILRALFHDNLHITGVCSGRNASFVEGLGANRVVDYTKGPVHTSLEGETFDVVFDIVGGSKSWETGKALLGAKGRFVTCVGPIEWIGDRVLRKRAQAKFFGKIMWNTALSGVSSSHPRYDLVTPTDVAAGKGTFQLAFSSHGARPHIERVISLAGGIEGRTAFEEGLEQVRSHRTKGKVIVKL